MLQRLWGIYGCQRTEKRLIQSGLCVDVRGKHGSVLAHLVFQVREPLHQSLICQFRRWFGWKICFILTGSEESFAKGTCWEEFIAALFLFSTCGACLSGSWSGVPVRVGEVRHWSKLGDGKAGH